MEYTFKIQKAIKFATKTHEVYQKQKRKGKDVAYITHPLTVGIILSLAQASEDVIVAGILHDTVEDCDTLKIVTQEMVEERFGKNVSDLVMNVTETNKNLSWEERKKEALEHIKHFSHDALLVKSADVLSNGRELLDDYEKDGNEVFERFNAPKEKIIIRQLKVIAAIVSCWDKNPIAGDLTFLAYKLQMIAGAQFMSGSPAKIMEYKDYDENEELECPVCEWKGTPKANEGLNTDSHHCADFSCPICGKETEVYTRVVGYFRAVKNWNEGKQEEYKERTEYKAEAVKIGETEETNGVCIF